MTPDKIFSYALKWRRDIEPMRRDLLQAANRDESLLPALGHLNALAEELKNWYDNESKKRGIT